MSEELTLLITRLSEAECGSRELDIAVNLAATGKFLHHLAPRYTTSIDAALTLVPKGYSWEVRKSGFGNPAQARIWNPRRSPPAFDPGNDWRATNERGCAAVALCIAALKARSVLHGQSGK